MNDFDIDKIDQEFQAGKYTVEDLKKLPKEIQRELSQKKADHELDKVQSEIDFQPRDWSKQPSPHYIGGIFGEDVHFISYLTVFTEPNAVFVSDIMSTVEFFRTRAKLDSFIDALTQARDNAFPADSAL